MSLLLRIASLPRAAGGDRQRAISWAEGCVLALLLCLAGAASMGVVVPSCLHPRRPLLVGSSETQRDDAASPMGFSHSFPSPGAGAGEMLPLHATGLMALHAGAPRCASSA